MKPGHSAGGPLKMGEMVIDRVVVHPISRRVRILNDVSLKREILFPVVLTIAGPIIAENRSYHLGGLNAPTAAVK